MSTVRIDVPDETLASLKTDAEAFAEEMRLLTAVKLFELGRLSSGRAAQLAGSREWRSWPPSAATEFPRSN